MERFNPFAEPEEPPPPAGAALGSNGRSLGRSGQLQRHQSASTQWEQSGASGSGTSSPSCAKQVSGGGPVGSLSQRQQVGLTSSADTLMGHSALSSRYSTSFPDPFGESDKLEPDSALCSSLRSELGASKGSPSGNRSNSVTFANNSHSIDDLTAKQHSPATGARRARLQERQATASGGLSSFLSRATSVTSSTVTDKVSEAVGSVRSAVDTISSQISSAVPANLNERISSATGQFTSSVVGGVGTVATGVVGAAGSPAPVSISRQRVVLILDDLNNTDWAHQFNNYRKLVFGSSSSGNQSTLSSFFTSATAQLSSAAGAATSVAGAAVAGGLGVGGALQQSNSYPNPSTNIICTDGLDLLIEQVDFRDVSVLANQITSQATVYINPPQQSKGTLRDRKSLQQATSNQTKCVRPEYVVVRQSSSKEQLEHLRRLVTSLEYCLIPMFEPYNVWNVFQDRQLIFSKLLSVQKLLGRENFPLVQQIFCQTYQDLLNYINSSTLSFPCLLRCGSLGRGRIKIDNLQMLKDFSSIIATSGMSCTLEHYLEVKCDLVVQKMGTSLKLFKRMAGSQQALFGSGSGQELPLGAQGLQERQSASRQTSLGSSVISGFISNNQSQQLARKSSIPPANSYERVPEVSSRYRNWIEAISREFDNCLQVFSLKIVIANNDREFIVNMNDCSNNFLGSPENQDEDRRSFVELIISNMNTNSFRGNSSHSRLSRESLSLIRRNSSNEANEFSPSPMVNQAGVRMNSSNESLLASSQLAKDKKMYASQTLMNGSQTNPGLPAEASGRPYGQLGNRSQSVSANQSEFSAGGDYTLGSPYNSLEAGERSGGFFLRRSSDKSSECLTNEMEELAGGGPGSSISSGSLHKRQASLGQSLFDQTSTALSSFQKQSMSFFKRLETRNTGNDLLLGSTPPQSAKSDKAFDRKFMLSSKNSAGAGLAEGGSLGGQATSGADKFYNPANGGFKSQSIDSAEEAFSGRVAPPKPPPPAPNLLGTARQSSLSSYSAASHAGSQTTPIKAQQNPTAIDNEPTNQQQANNNPGGRAKVVRQNSALSAFEPYDPEVAAKLREEPLKANGEAAAAAGPLASNIPQAPQEQRNSSCFDSVKKASVFDSASITSADSNSTGETAAAEDTMNNLKKTFASIFGDKCE